MKSFLLFQTLSELITQNKTGKKFWRKGKRPLKINKYNIQGRRTRKQLSHQRRTFVKKFAYMTKMKRLGNKLYLSSFHYRLIKASVGGEKSFKQTVLSDGNLHSFLLFNKFWNKFRKSMEVDLPLGNFSAFDKKSLALKCAWDKGSVDNLHRAGSFFGAKPFAFSHFFSLLAKTQLAFFGVLCGGLFVLFCLCLAFGYLLFFLNSTVSGGYLGIAQEVYRNHGFFFIFEYAFLDDIYKPGTASTYVETLLEYDGSYSLIRPMLFPEWLKFLDGDWGFGYSYYYKQFGKEVKFFPWNLNEYLMFYYDFINKYFNTQLWRMSFHFLRLYLWPVYLEYKYFAAYYDEIWHGNLYFSWFGRYIVAGRFVHGDYDDDGFYFKYLYTKHMKKYAYKTYFPWMPKQRKIQFDDEPELLIGSDGWQFFGEFYGFYPFETFQVNFFTALFFPYTGEYLWTRLWVEIVETTGISKWVYDAYIAEGLYTFGWRTLLKFPSIGQHILLPRFSQEMFYWFSFFNIIPGPSFSLYTVLLPTFDVFEVKWTKPEFPVIFRDNPITGEFEAIRCLGIKQTFVYHFPRYRVTNTFLVLLPYFIAGIDRIVALFAFFEFLVLRFGFSVILLNDSVTLVSKIMFSNVPFLLDTYLFVVGGGEIIDDFAEVRELGFSFEKVSQTAPVVLENLLDWYSHVYFKSWISYAFAFFFEKASYYLKSFELEAFQVFFDVSSSSFLYFTLETQQNLAGHEVLLDFAYLCRTLILDLSQFKFLSLYGDRKEIESFLLATYSLVSPFLLLSFMELIVVDLLLWLSRGVVYNGFYFDDKFLNLFGGNFSESHGLIFSQKRLFSVVFDVQTSLILFYNSYSDFPIDIMVFQVNPTKIYFAKMGQIDDLFLEVLDGLVYRVSEGDMYMPFRDVFSWTLFPSWLTEGFYKEYFKTYTIQTGWLAGHKSQNYVQYFGKVSMLPDQDAYLYANGVTLFMETVLWNGSIPFMQMYLSMPFGVYSRLYFTHLFLMDMGGNFEDPTLDYFFPEAGVFVTFDDWDSIDRYPFSVDGIFGTEGLFEFGENGRGLDGVDWVLGEDISDSGNFVSNLYHVYISEQADANVLGGDLGAPIFGCYESVFDLLAGLGMVDPMAKVNYDYYIYALGLYSLSGLGLEASPVKLYDGPKDPSYVDIMDPELQYILDFLNSSEFRLMNRESDPLYLGNAMEVFNVLEGRFFSRYSFNTYTSTYLRTFTLTDVYAYYWLQHQYTVASTQDGILLNQYLTRSLIREHYTALTFLGGSVLGEGEIATVRSLMPDFGYVFLRDQFILGNLGQIVFRNIFGLPFVWNVNALAGQGLVRRVFQYLIFFGYIMVPYSQGNLNFLVGVRDLLTIHPLMGWQYQINVPFLRYVLDILLGGQFLYFEYFFFGGDSVIWPFLWKFEEIARILDLVRTDFLIIKGGDRGVLLYRYIEALNTKLQMRGVTRHFLPYNLYRNNVALTVNQPGMPLEFLEALDGYDVQYKKYIVDTGMESYIPVANTIKVGFHEHMLINPAKHATKGHNSGYVFGLHDRDEIYLSEMYFALVLERIANGKSFVGIKVPFVFEEMILKNPYMQIMENLVRIQYFGYLEGELNFVPLKRLEFLNANSILEIWLSHWYNSANPGVPGIGFVHEIFLVLYSLIVFCLYIYCGFYMFNILFGIRDSWEFFLTFLYPGTVVLSEEFEDDEFDSFMLYEMGSDFENEGGGFYFAGADGLFLPYRRFSEDSFTKMQNSVDLSRSFFDPIKSEYLYLGKYFIIRESENFKKEFGFDKLNARTDDKMFAGYRPKLFKPFFDFVLTDKRDFENIVQNKMVDFDSRFLFFVLSISFVCYYAPFFWQFWTFSWIFIRPKGLHFFLNESFLLSLDPGCMDMILAIGLLILVVIVGFLFYYIYIFIKVGKPRILALTFNANRFYLILFGFLIFNLLSSKRFWEGRLFKMDEVSIFSGFVHNPKFIKDLAHAKHDNINYLQLGFRNTYFGFASLNDLTFPILPISDGHFFVSDMGGVMMNDLSENNSINYKNFPALSAIAEKYFSEFVAPTFKVDGDVFVSNYIDIHFNLKRTESWFSTVFFNTTFEYIQGQLNSSYNCTILPGRYGLSLSNSQIFFPQRYGIGFEKKNGNFVVFDIVGGPAPFLSSDGVKNVRFNNTLTTILFTSGWTIQDGLSSNIFSEYTSKDFVKYQQGSYQRLDRSLAKLVERSFTVDSALGFTLIFEKLPVVDDDFAVETPDEAFLDQDNFLNRAGKQNVLGLQNCTTFEDNLENLSTRAMLDTSIPFRGVDLAWGSVDINSKLDVVSKTGSSFRDRFYEDLEQEKYRKILAKDVGADFDKFHTDISGQAFSKHNGSGDIAKNYKSYSLDQEYATIFYDISGDSVLSDIYFKSMRRDKGQMPFNEEQIFAKRFVGDHTDLE